MEQTSAVRPEIRTNPVSSARPTGVIRQTSVQVAEWNQVPLAMFYYFQDLPSTGNSENIAGWTVNVGGNQSPAGSGGLGRRMCSHGSLPGVWPHSPAG